MNVVETVEKSYAKGEDIQRVIAKFETVVEDEKLEVINMACLALSLAIQYPAITAEQIQKGVYGASQWIALYVSSLTDEGTALASSKVN